MTPTRSPTRLTHWFSDRLRAFRRDFYAVPLDLFRIVAGLLIVAYLLVMLRDAHEFTSPNALIDHELSRRLFWFTRHSLIFPGLPGVAITGLMIAALLAAAAIVLGIRPRLAAGVCFLITVSIQRWNHLVFFVDDMFIQMSLFWLMLMPVGTTLTVRFGKPRRNVTSDDRWRSTVPGLRVRLFLANICLMYLVAGSGKFSSAMWRDGFALYAVLRLPISRMPDAWRPHMLPWLAVANYFAIVAELAIPLLLCSRSRRLRLIGFAIQAAFHVGIIAFFDVPFASLMALSTALLFLAPDIVRGALRGRVPEPPPLSAARLNLLDRAAMLVVAALAVANVSKPQDAGPVSSAAWSLLWTVGLAQEYHLFDWVDEKNYHRVVAVSAVDPAGRPLDIPAARLFPDHVRNVLLELNLYGLAWMPMMDRRYLDDFKASLRSRIAARFCKRERFSGRVEVGSWMSRSTRDNLDGHVRQWFPLLTFEADNGRIISINSPPDQLTDNAR